MNQSQEIQEYLHKTFHAAHSRWLKSNGDKTHRLNYNLDENSIVIDLGGYQGDFASDMYSMFRCKIYTFEPIKNYYDFIVNRFKKNDRIYPFNFGLSEISCTTQLSLESESSSAFKESENKVDVRMVEFEQFLIKYQIEKVDLLKINIEGSEYSLLEYIVSKPELLKRIGNLQIQFHTFVDDCISRRNFIRNELSKTHTCTYDYEYIWENWELKHE